MEEILSPLDDSTHAVHDVQATSVNDSDTLVVFALIVCFTLILFIAFRLVEMLCLSDLTLQMKLDSQLPYIITLGGGGMIMQRCSFWIPTTIGRVRYKNISMLFLFLVKTVSLV